MKKKMSKVIASLSIAAIAILFMLAPSSAEVVQLTCSIHNPEMSPAGQAMKHWDEMVEQESKGKVKIDVHYGGVLLNGKEAYRGIQTGIADLGHYVLDKREGFLLNTVIALPFMGWPSQVDTGEIFKKINEKFPEAAKEWKGVKMIAAFMMPPTNIHTAKKQIKTPQDLKGLKMHGAENTVIESLAALGATPVNLDIGDMYMSLDRGLINGVMNHFPVLSIFGVLELLKYHTVLGDGGINMSPMCIIFNAESFDKLPPDVRDLILGAERHWVDTILEKDLAMQAKAIEQAKADNHVFTHLTKDEVSEWRKLVKVPIHDKWIKAAEDKGLPGKAVYDTTLELIARYNK